MKRALAILGLQILLALGLQAQVVVSAPVTCATTVDGTMVGVLNPLQPPQLSTSFSGTLAAGNYFVQVAWYDAAGHLTLPGTEVKKQLTATGSLTVSLPANGKPQNAVGMKVYIGSSSGGETLQGTTTGTAAYTQSSALTSGAAVPTTNNTLCQVAANDAAWPTGTGYRVTINSSNGTVMPGFPSQWQLLGPGTTINVSNGLPLYNGNVTYPIPILARPYNHVEQSISGPLSLTHYNLLDVGAIGVGTGTPGYAIDVENGAVNASGGFVFNGGAGVSTGNCLSADSDLAHTFRIPVPCVSSLPTTYYQTLQSNGTPQTQEPAANFSTNFTLGTASGATTIDLIHVGTPGTYVSPSSFTTDAFGRVSAVVASSAVNTTCTGTTPPWSCYRVEADGTTTEWGVSSAAPTGNSYAMVSISFPLTLTNTTHLELNTNPDNCPPGNNCPAGGNGWVLSSVPVASTISTTGFTAYLDAGAPVGGGGGQITGTVHVHWRAVWGP